MLAIEKFIKENENWKELIQQAPYFLKIDEDEDYVLIKYDMINSDFTQEIVNECRGIIIDKHTNKAHALSFKKFFNIQEELHADIDWKTARVQEKVDGSKILYWYNEYKNEWQVSTSGTLDAYKAQVNDSGITFGQLFDAALLNSINAGITDFEKLHTFDEMLGKQYCYTFELVSPESRIVVPYKKTELYFIGVRNIVDFKELRPTQLILSDLIKTPKSYPLHTLEDCLKATEKMGFDEEGFVVVDDNWNRVKIKSPEYVLAHHARANGATSISRVLEMIENGYDKDFLKIYPEYTEKFDNVKEAKGKFNQHLKERLLNLKNELVGKYHLERKAIANYIQMNDKDISAFLFKLLDTDLIQLYIDTEWNKLPKNRKLKYLGFKEEKDAEEFKEE